MARDRRATERDKLPHRPCKRLAILRPENPSSQIAMWMRNGDPRSELSLVRSQRGPVARGG